MSGNFLERLAELPGNLSNHLMITVIALTVGVALSLPLAVFLVKRRKLRYPILTGAGVIQTIPSLALLALMVPILDRTGGLGLGLDAFGLPPAVIALTLYSVLPVLRNTVTGILGVAPDLTEAARGVGMTERQVLWKVELPLAAPVILAGIRTATVWVVGIATLATPVGQRCLGNYIFTGLQTRNWVMVLFGVVSAAALAMLLDLLVGGIQRAVEHRKRRLGLLSATGLGLVLIGGLVSPGLMTRTHSGSAGPEQSSLEPAKAACPHTIRVGSKTFTEQYILTRLISLRLQAAGFQIRPVQSLGSTIVFDALCGGNLDVYVDYTGTIWANYMKQDRVLAPWQVQARIGGWLTEKHGIRMLGTLGFENAYVLAMRRDRAAALGIETIPDLAGHARELSIGGDYEFFGRPDWRRIRDIYGLRFRDQVSFDSTLMYPAVSSGQVDVIAAFSSDGRIQAYDLALLEDSHQAIPPYDAILLLGSEVAECQELVQALRPLLDKIPVEHMQRANWMVDRDEDKKTVEEAAAWLHEQIAD